MRVLGIDTSGKNNSVALLKDGKILAEKFLPEGGSTSGGLLELIDQTLDAAGCRAAELDLIALAHGPGSFTSLRVGVSVAKGLAWTLDKPLAGVNTLDALAQRAENSVKALLCPILNAHQGQAYAAFYRRQDGSVVKISQDLLICPAKLAAGIKEPVFFLGAGLEVYQEQLQATLAELAEFAPSQLYYPQAAIIARLGLRHFKTGQSSSAVELTPYYIRRPSAEVMWEQHG